MPDDILVAIPESDRATHRKPRWHQVIIRNGEGLTDKSLEAQGQTVPVRLVDVLPDPPAFVLAHARQFRASFWGTTGAIGENRARIEQPGTNE